LRRAVGAASAHHLHELANGRDDRRVVPNLPEKSVGAEQTFARDEADRTALRRELLRLIERATAALRHRGLRGRTITLKIRHPDFTTISRSRTLADPTDSTHTVYAVAAELLDAHLPPGMLVRLLGVRIDQLSRGAVAEQLTLDAAGIGAPRSAHWSDAERAADAARSRFGSAAVRPATLLDTPGAAGAGRSQLSPESGNGIG
jgi:DNA polymerase-4